jgi:[ribosomal protein S18]-alanine N-acetyltransferase
MKLERMRWWHIPDAVRLDEQLFGDEAWSTRMMWSELAQGASRHYLIAVDDDKIVGYAGLAAFPDEGSIQTIGVRADRQRHGIGTSLLQALLAEADRRRVAHVILEVRADNLDAQRLYAKHGFAPLRIRRGYYQPSGTDAVEMRRG